MNFLQNHIESLIFCSNEPIKAEEIRQCLNEMFEAEIPGEDIQTAIEALLTKYENEDFPFQIFKIASGYQFLTKPAYQSSISILLKQKSKKRLSTSALETIAIIAYKQPISKGQIEQIRGVNCDYAIQKLLEKELIEIKGKSEGVGRPILYGTSQKFLEYFGINDMKDLPTPKDFAREENEIGELNEKDLDIDMDSFASAEIPTENSNPTDSNNDTPSDSLDSDSDNINE
ncbi:MAG: SMC-Scp complex subunit ScpB [Cytophagaceae bacterium]|nr:SMC-Scp complex subunit ScpB [Cytophagaceae bacterium]